MLIEPPAVVLDQQRHTRGLVGDAQSNHRRVRVLDDVGQRLLRDAKDLVRLRLVERRRLPGHHKPCVESAYTPRPLDLVGQHILQVAVVARRAQYPEHRSAGLRKRVPRLAVRGGDQRCRVAAAAGGGEGVFGAGELTDHTDQALIQRVVHLAQEPLPLGRGGVGARPLLGDVVHARVRQGDCGVFREQLQQLRVGR